MIFFLQILAFIVFCAIGLAGVALPFFASFWALDNASRPAFWIVGSILAACAVLALSITLCIASFGWFGWQESDNRAHCGPGTTYVETSHTVLMPVSTGKSTVLVPETVTDWQCVVSER